MSIYIRQLLSLGALTLLGFALFVLMFWAGIEDSVTILFYRGIILAAASAICVGIVGLWYSRRAKDCSVAVTAAALSLSFNLCFLILLPVTIDRSVSVYLLGTIERSGPGGADRYRLERALVDGYVVRMDAVDRRLEEQRRSGNVEIDQNGAIRLTPQGKRFMVLSRIVGRLFQADPRLVAGFSGAGRKPEASTGQQAR